MNVIFWYMYIYIYLYVYMFGFLSMIASNYHFEVFFSQHRGAGSTFRFLERVIRGMGSLGVASLALAFS